jgi:hypothetical protein
MAKKATNNEPFVRYADLKAQRKKISTKALILYKGELYNQHQFMLDHGGGSWKYKPADLQIHDPDSNTNYPVNASIR